MPIKGLIERALPFPKIGDIRKGEKRKNSKGVEYPVDLDYFKVTFGAAYEVQAKKFLDAYGEKPDKINILLANNNIDRVWDYWLEAYTASRLIAKSDGEFMNYWVHWKTGEVIAKAGDNMKCPEDLVVGKDKNGNPIKMKYTGRLNVVIPELKYFGFLTLHTTSIIDVKAITAQLYGVEEMAIKLGVELGRIPLTMLRAKQSVSVPKGDSKTERMRVDKWMVQIAPQAEWAEKAIGALRDSAFQLMQPEETLALGSGEAAMLEESTDAPDAYDDAIDADFVPNEPPGYEDDFPKPDFIPDGKQPGLLPAVEKSQKPKGLMALDMAKTAKGSKGDVYWETPTEELRGKLIGITRLLAKDDLNDKQREDAMFKKGAIEAIIWHRENEQEE